MDTRFFLTVPLSLLLVVSVVFGEEEEMVYISLEENPEVVKERVSDAFWDNPLNTPPLLVLIAIAGLGAFVAWKRKWHIHEKTSDMKK